VSENPALEAHEHHEHAEHAVHEHDPFISRVSVTIAVLAVVTAVTGSLEITESSGAITASSRAVLAQDRATDAWGAFQAASLKKHLYQIAADLPDKANDDVYRPQSQKYSNDQAGYQATAKAQEKARDAALEESERHEHRHHRLTIAATLLQIGIAISTVAIITRRRPFWWGALALGLVGAAAAGSAYL
jgi:hypothetical protein